jgi:MtrB/PioB family decaheme-associated outer membrane protein
MKPDPYNRFESLVKAAFSALAIIAVALSPAPDARSQSQPDDKNKQQETKAPAAPIGPTLPEGFKVAFDIGGNVRPVAGDRPGKFQETRSFPEGPYLRNFYFDFNSVASPFFLNLKGLELGERDRRVSAELGRVGKYQARFLWDEIPHFYSDGRSFHVSTAPGVLSVDPALRARLQAALPVSNAPGSAVVNTSFPASVRQELQSQAGVELRVRWNQLLLTQSYRPNENWEFFLNAQNLRRNGVRPRPTGTFANENSTDPALRGDLLWEALGMELPEPVDYRTTNITLGFQYSRSKWRIGAQYDYSLFKNFIQSLTWENPFRTTDALANSPGFNNGRNRFVRAQLALPPDNEYRSFSMHASLDLPRETQLRGAVAWGRGEQHEPFLPYTLNTAMVAANLLPGQPPLFNLAPPQFALNGVIRTMNQDYALASRPWKKMRFLLQYRYNDKDNQTPIIVFPGLPAFGDSGVRTAVDFYDQPLENFPASYARQNTTATWELDLRRNLNWELEYDWEVWNRTFREATRTNEHSVRGWLNYKPRTGVALKADYRYSLRKPRFYLTQPMTFNPNLNVGTAAAPISGGPGWEVTPAPNFHFNHALREEFSQLRRFDLAKRIRSDGGVALEVTRWENVTFSASYRYLRDDYDKNFYGLLYDTQSAVDAEISFIPFPAPPPPDETTPPADGWRERSFFFVHYSREQNQIGYRGLGHRINGAARNVTACCATFPIANTFERNSRINYDMFEFGFNTASKGERTVLHLTYGGGFARDRTHTANPFPILAVSLRTAGAYNYPDVINWQQEATFSLTHRLRPGLSLGFSYRFEPYRLDDYYTNNMQPYSAQQPAATVATALTPRYLFLDARFTSYHANVATVFLRYSFGGAQ